MTGQDWERTPSGLKQLTELTKTGDLLKVTQQLPRAMARIQVRALLLIPIRGTSLVKSGVTGEPKGNKNRDKNELFITNPKAIR